MAQAICRCGHALTLPSSGGERVVCPGCGARVRVRRAAPGPGSAPTDDFIRFHCECGRRLKVPGHNRPSHGQCPDCGRIVPIPERSDQNRLPAGHPETPTAELDVADRQLREEWIQRHHQNAAPTEFISNLSLAEDPSLQPQAAERTPGTAQPEPSTVLAIQPTKPARVEHGLRTCPGCGRPVHIQAETCRNCGAAVPRR